MIDFQSPLAIPAAFTFGVALHLFVFRIGEWDIAATRLLAPFALLHIAATAALVRFLPSEYVSVLSAAATVLGLGLSMVMGLTVSMLVYRGFFHRLGIFPGPFLARFSNLYVTSLSAKNLHLYEEVQRLHKQYGDFVRIAPSEISVIDPNAIFAIHSGQSGCTKGPWYNVLHPMVSLQMIRDKREHIRRRKVWDRGFSAKALRDYEPRVTGHADELMAQLAKMEGTPVNVSDWFNFYSFDVMGDLAWGKSLGMLSDGIKHYFMTSLHADMASVGLFSHMLWLFPIFKATPILNSENKKFWRWIKTQVDSRKQMKPERPDVFSSLLEAHTALGTPTQQDEVNLLGDAYLIAVAGSDTTAASLTCLFYQLALYPDCAKTLQQEVDELFDTEAGEVTVGALTKLQYLDAVINETLRLHPPVPSGVQRMTPPEGLRIGETFVPGNTIVQVPSHTMFRDDRFFERPDDFIPERWTTQKELTKDASIYVPFSTGRYSCIGKHLGLMEIRWVTTQIIRLYDVAMAPGQSSQQFLDGKKDTFTLALAPLRLVFTKRKTS